MHEDIFASKHIIRDSVPFLWDINNSNPTNTSIGDVLMSVMNVFTHI